jgi:NitT/TauT family transport system substrate-binding protein
MKEKDFITEEQTVYEVLIKYPQLREVLVAISPKYKRLYNPVLFNTVAKVTTLKKAAQIGNVYIKEFLYQLNSAIGKGEEFLQYFKSQIPKMQEEFLKKQFGNKTQEGKEPEWISKINDFKILDARKIEGEPFVHIIEFSNKINKGEGFILIQKFIPSPIISYLETLGFKSWMKKESDDMFKVYFYKE